MFILVPVLYYFVDRGFVLKSESVNLLTLFFLFKTVLATLSPLQFQMNFKISLLISAIRCDSDGNCVDSADHFEE